MTKRRYFFTIAVILLTLSIPALACADDPRHPLGYYTTDLYLLAITPTLVLPLAHSTIAPIYQSTVRTLPSYDPLCTLLYTSDEFDIATYNTLLIIIYYRGTLASQMVCLGDAVQ